jgi:CubicO group peptidase (beta-lactamase class C family)
MTRLIGVLAVVVLLFFPSVKADPVDLDAVLAEAMRPTQVPAMGMLVIRDGAISTVAVRGVRRSDGADPVSAGDIWHIGSDGKAMTATLIASLVDRGVLSWDASLAQMLPDLVDRMRPEYREVTLIQLLSHHAGLPHDVSDTRFIDSFYADRRPLPEQRLAYIARALEEPPVAPPGTTFNYSNTGF